MSMKCSSSGTLSSSGSSNRPMRAWSRGALETQPGEACYTCYTSVFASLSISTGPLGINLPAGRSPEFGVLRVHHGRTLRQDLCYADRADFLLDGSRNLLDFWDDYFFQHHAEHPVRGRAKVGINPGGKEAASSLPCSHLDSVSEGLGNASVYKVRGL